MKLLMISGDRAILQGKKGAFWHTLEEMSRHWERIDVICPRVGGVESGKWKVENYPFPNVCFHPSSFSLWRQSKWIFEKGKELIAEYHHDVMTVHEYPPFYNGLGARWLHSATNIPYMTEIHHIVGYPNAASLSERIGYWMSRIWLPRWGTDLAQAVRIVSTEAGEELRKWKVPPAKIMLQSSLYLDRSALASDPGIAKSHDVVFCGRLVPNKRLSDVIRAVAQLPNVTLLIIGDGPERRKCEKLAETLGMESRIAFTGWLASQADVYRAIQSARIFVMNSSSEGGPRVLFEAMALGMPVISTRVGAAPQFIDDGHDGLLTKGDPNDLRDKIKMLLRNEQERLRLGAAARYVLDIFDRGMLVKIYADSLKSLVSASNS
ncbi:glycosyltransferase [Candidatus Peregrinibacteria bacterium]|nr:glycosyltransferase [Candidatus Peregrinibacteria bacterium]